MVTRLVALLLGPLLLGARLTASAEEKVVIREEFKADDAWAVNFEIQARGELQVGGALKFSALGRLAFEEKLLPPDAPSGSVTRKSLRFYQIATVESTVAENRSTLKLRDPLRVVVAEVRRGEPFLFSPSGPLTREELELLEAQCDSLVLHQLLPAQAVAVGDSWKPDDAALSAVLNLASVRRNQLQAKLEQMNAQTARITLHGDVHGVSYEAEKKLAIVGEISFDRRRSRIKRVELTISEEHAPDPIEPGFKGEARIVLTRNLDAAITRLNEKGLEKLPLQSNPATEQLEYVQPDGRYRFYFPRGWHIYHGNPRVAVLRLHEKGEWIAQCNVTAAPTVAAGTHMNPEEFRSQVQMALGSQFQKLLQEGQVPAAEGYWVYRVAAAGTVDNHPVVWYYYLVSGPQGDQLVFTFTLAGRYIDQFGGRDLALVGSLEFNAARTASNRDRDGGK